MGDKSQLINSTADEAVNNVLGGSKKHATRQWINSTQSIGRLPPYKTHSVRDSWDWFWIRTLLSFHSHIEQISKKITSGIFVLRNLRNSVNTYVFMAAYYGLIYLNLADVVLI